MEFVRTFKAENPCSNCKEHFHFAAMDLHHRNPTEKSLRLAQMYGYSLGALQTEMDKCDLLCANCHRVTHYEISTMENEGT